MTEKLYTIEDIRKAFESGFLAFNEIDRNYGNWKEAIEEGLNDEFQSFIESLKSK